MSESKKYRGKSKIIDLLRSSARIQGKSLVELHKETKLSKPTVLYHLKNLQDKGFVEKNKISGKYKLKANDELITIILDGLRKEKTIDELFILLKKNAKKNETNKQLQKLTSSSDSKEFLKDVLEFLFDNNYVGKRTDQYQIYATGTSEQLWYLTWLGCKQINICYVCKDHFQSSEKIIVNTIQVGSYALDTHAALIHTKCLNLVKPIPDEDDYDYCGHCGLPVSRNRLEELLPNSVIDTLKFLEKNLNLTEYYFLRKFIIKNIQINLYDSCKIKIPNDDITIISLDNIRIKIDRPEFKNKINDKKYYVHLYTFINFQTFHESIGEYRTEIDFEYLEHPSLLNFDTLFYEIKESFKNEDKKFTYSEERVKEILKEWKELEIKKHVMISKLYSKPTEQIISSIPPFSNPGF